MSLDVTLYDNKVKDAIDKAKGVSCWLQSSTLPVGGFLDNQQKMLEIIGMLEAIEPQEIYSSNITHNLNKMAMEADIYEHLWRPDEINITRARDLIEPLRIGLELLDSYPERFKAFDSPNGWGLYEHFVPFVREYLAACVKWPDALVKVSR